MNLLTPAERRDGAFAQFVGRHVFNVRGDPPYMSERVRQYVRPRSCRKTDRSPWDAV
jgi:hypothetical protein